MVLEITVSLVSIKKPLYQCYPNYTKRVISHRVLYLTFLSTYMYYLSACNKGPFKRYHCFVLFWPLEKSFRCYEIYFQFHLYIVLKKIYLLTNIRNKGVIRKINLYLFDVMKNGHIFPSEVCHFQYDYRSHFSRKIGNIREYKEVRLEMKNRLGRVFSTHFLYLALFLFLMSWSWKIQNTLKPYFPLLTLKVTNRGGIFLRTCL